MTAIDKLHLQAVRGALQTRLKLGLGRGQPVSVYEAASRLGIPVWFLSRTTLEGAFEKTSGAIVVGALRPFGRRAFTCAHEIGHWHFGHGSCAQLVDASDESARKHPDEILANTFASHFLMPRWAVTEAFEVRGWNTSEPTPLQVLAVASQLSVGYTTLIHHMRWSLALIGQSQAEALLRTSPGEIAARVLGGTKPPRLVLVDLQWNSIAIDLEVGDFALLPADVRLEGDHIVAVRDDAAGVVTRALKPGISRAEHLASSWAAYVRVSRSQYEGMADYRHTEGLDVD